MNKHDLRIMVADNEEVVRELIARYLSGLGYAVDQVPNGNECLKQLRDKQYDLVFLDLVMPGVDGETALDAIRKRYPDTDVVVVSSQDDDRVIGDILARGARAYLTKPFTQEHIEEVIRKVAHDRNGVPS